MIALVRPLPISAPVLQFYLPVAAATVAFISGVLITGRVDRWARAVRQAFYLLFVLRGFRPADQTGRVGLDLQGGSDAGARAPA